MAVVLTVLLMHLCLFHAAVFSRKAAPADVDGRAMVAASATMRAGVSCWSGVTPALVHPVVSSNMSPAGAG